MPTPIKVAIAGVGNCASSLIQGVEYYRGADPDEIVPGLMHVVLGGHLSVEHGGGELQQLPGRDSAGDKRSDLVCELRGVWRGSMLPGSRPHRARAVRLGPSRRR